MKRQKDELEETNTQYKVQLKRTNLGFGEKIKELDVYNDELIKETSKLQNQKEALVGKIREYQS